MVRKQATEENRLDTRLIERFLDARFAERNIAENTGLAYRSDLTALAIFLQQRAATLKNCARHDLEAWFQNLQESGFRSTSAARRHSCVSQFYRFLLAEGIVAEDPSLHVVAPRHRRALPQTPSLDNVRSLFAHLSHRGAEGLRLRLLLEIAYGSGLRVSELVSLEVGALSRDPPVVTVLGKGGKPRSVPLLASAFRAFEAYLSVRERFIPKHRRGSSPYLFPSSARRGHLTRQRFGQLLKQAAGQAGLDARALSPHKLRHAFATHLLAGGADLRAIQSMLGHADITTTQIYTEVMEQKLKDLVFQKHPLAKRGRGN